MGVLAKNYIKRQNTPSEKVTEKHKLEWTQKCPSHWVFLGGLPFWPFSHSVIQEKGQLSADVPYFFHFSLMDYTKG